MKVVMETTAFSPVTLFDLDNDVSDLSSIVNESLKNETGLSASLHVQVCSILLLDIMCLCGNVFLLVIIYSNKQLHTISNMLIVNLAITDLLVAIVILPLWTVTMATQVSQRGLNVIVVF